MQIEIDILFVPESQARTGVGSALNNDDRTYASRHSISNASLVYYFACALLLSDASSTCGAGAEALSNNSE